MIFGRKNFFFTRTSCFLAIEFPFVVKKPGSYRMTSRLPAWAGGRIMNLSVSVRLPCLPACRRLRKLQVYLRCLQVYLPACTCVVCKCTWQFQVAISGSGLLSSRHRPESLADGLLLLLRNGCRPPGIHIMGWTIIEVVEQSQGPSERNSIRKVCLDQGLQASPRIMSFVGRFVRMNLSR